MKIVNLDNDVLEKAYKLCTKTLNEQEIFDALKGSDDVVKQASILQISDVLHDEHAELLVSHLTGHDGPVREASAIKLCELIISGANKNLDKIKFYPIYADALCDVNPNICRFIIDFLPYLEFKDEIVKTVLSKIDRIFYRIDNPDKEQKNFLTVRLFNLYWSLEALGELIENNMLESYKSKILSIFKRAILFSDYTINEKIAKILTRIEDKEFFADIISELKVFDNFYVKRYFKD